MFLLKLFKEGEKYDRFSIFKIFYCFKYFFLFGSSWEGIYLLKHFKNKKNSESWIASKLFYFLLVVINIGLILNVLQLFLLFLTSDFTFSNNYLPE